MALPGLSLSQKYRGKISRIAGLISLCLLAISDHSWPRNSFVDMAFEFAGLALIVFCTFGRLWASIYASGYKDDTIVDVGPYSVVRNPLYLFSFIGTIGLGLASENLLFLVLATLWFTAYYPFVIRSEEAYLTARFGERYLKYKAATPRFIPRFNLMKKADTYTVHTKVFQRSMIDATMFIWGYILLQMIERMHQTQIMPVLMRFP